MSDPDKAAHRSYHTPTPDTVTFRDADELDGDEDMMEIRMPIASTGEVRNDGDDPLSGSELRGMAQQVDTLTRGVFPEHGQSSAIDAGQYSQFEKLGYWADADIRRDEGTDKSDLLMATARMPDPETLPAATGPYRQSLAIIKEQAKRGIPIAASIGWRDDPDMPGGVDLMESSIVGVQADWQTVTAGGTEALARAAVEAGADKDDFVAEVRRIMTRADDPDDTRPFGPPGDPERWADHGQCVAEVEDWDGVDDPDAYCAWAKSQTEDRGNDTDMTDDDTADQGGTTDDEQNADADGETREDDETREGVDPNEFRSEMLEMQRQQTETLSMLVDSMREDMEDDDEDEEGDDEEEDDEDRSVEDSENDADDTERSADEDADEETETRALEERINELEAALDDVRDGDAEVTTPQQEATDEQRANDNADGDESAESEETTRESDEGVFNGLGDFATADR